MSVVHFATELSGGAGGFVKNIHIAMLDLGLPSFIITRERNDLNNSVTIKPLTRVAGSLRARWLTLLGKLGVINTSYAMFGIERSPVGLSDIQHALGSRTPNALIFYWVAYFVNFKTILKLRQVYPEIPFVFVCLDEAFLTGGCHYSCGCLGYQEACNNCPATSSTRIKKRIEQGFRQRQALLSAINPIVIYPTTNIQLMGKKSAVLKNTRSLVIPLGAISNKELNLATDLGYRERSDRNFKKEEITLLVRSSSEYRKGCDLFVSAITVLSERMPNIRARLKVISIGDETLTTAHIDKYVNHVDMGYVQRKELMSLYHNVDALIVTSREDTGPLMINECVALGIFVISTPIGVANDLIIEKQNGIITRDVSSDAISDALISFLDNYNMTRSEVEHVSASQTRRSSLTFDGYIRALMDVIKPCS
jgi:glycosyltransferase involved in cell wall biosynthesis